ncbi:hypothetical protein Z045_24915 [Rhodococcus pyridinivorans KG-16]|uniref:Uncharacterized protein n=1 Tax=Rhodococcus pyridinivorans KG-16 TaxID=1441730 RepID=A0A0V9UDP6_9NOCA|nr:hypothetical protein Z045_24915 [Rhodococcus pyridinivorans KG-16]
MPLDADRAWALCAEGVVGVQEETGLHGQTSTADATGQFVFEVLDLAKPFLQLAFPPTRDALPVLVGGRMVGR